MSGIVFLYLENPWVQFYCWSQPLTGPDFLWFQCWLSLDPFGFGLKQTWTQPRPSWLHTDSFPNTKIRSLAAARLRPWLKPAWREKSQWHTLLIRISAIDFSVSSSMNWPKMSYYALCRLPVKQKLHSTQSSCDWELCFDQWRLQLRFFNSIRLLCPQQLLTVEKI